MHTVQLLLKTSKYERHEIDRRFRALAHLHNVLWLRSVFLGSGQNTLSGVLLLCGLGG